MRRIRELSIAAVIVAITLSAFSPEVFAGKNEYDAVCDHIEEKYNARKVKVPFMWLARMAVGIVRPAGVKSFKVTIYKNLNFSKDTLDTEMREVMSDAFSEEWSPILRVVSKDGEQVYMNMRQYKKSVKVLLVAIDRDEAFVVRARFNPEKLAEFIENPKIFGISLDGKSGDDLNRTEPSEPPQLITTN